MGLAASQARLLTLTSRKSDIEYRLMDIANQKLAMSRDSAKLSEDYSNALNAKLLTWDIADGGTAPLTYNLIMTQNDQNSAGQFLISDSRGRVILNSDLVNKLGLAGTTQSGDAGIDENLFLQKMMAPITSTQADAYINEINGTGSTNSEVPLTTMATDFANVLSYATSDNVTQTYNDDKLEAFKATIVTASADVDQEIKGLTTTKTASGATLAGVSDAQMDYLNNTDKWSSLALDANGNTLIDDNMKEKLGCEMTTVTKDLSGNIISTSTGTQKSTAVTASISGSVGGTGVSLDGSISTYSMAAAKNVASVTDSLTTTGSNGQSADGWNYDSAHYGHCADNTDIDSPEHWNVAGTRTTVYNDGTATKTTGVVYCFGSFSNGKYGNLLEVRSYDNPVSITSGSDHHSDIISSTDVAWARIVDASTKNEVNANSVIKFTTANGTKTTSTDNYNSSGTKVSTTSAVYKPEGYSDKYQELQYLVRLKRSLNAAQQMLNLYTGDGGNTEGAQIITAAISLILSGGTAGNSGVGRTNEIENLLANGDDSNGLSGVSRLTTDSGSYTTYLDYNQDGAWKDTTCGASNYQLLNDNGASHFSENLTDLFSNYKTIRSNRSQTEQSTTLTNISTANYYVNLWNAMNSQGWVLDTDMDKDTTGKGLQNKILNGSAYIYKLQDDGSWSLTSTSTTDTPINTENDNNAATAAEARYTAEKDKVDYKESQLDITMNNLDTERTAVDTEMESVQKIIDSNIKKFKIFDA